MQELEDKLTRKRVTDQAKDRGIEKEKKTGCHVSWVLSFIGVSFCAPPLIYFFLPLKLKSYNDTPANKVI